MEKTDARKPKTDTPVKFWRQMLQTADMFRNVIKKEDDRAMLNRITINQARIFGYIFSNAESDVPIRISDLAHDLDISVAAAGQSVDRLVNAGLVDRTPDPSDRRALVISFSRKGLDLLAEYEERSEAVARDLVSGLPKADLAAFSRVTATMTARLTERWNAMIAEKRSAACSGNCSGACSGA